MANTVTVRTLLSTAGAQSLINYQEEKVGATPLCFTEAFGHASFDMTFVRHVITLTISLYLS